MDQNFGDAPHYRMPDGREFWLLDQSDVGQAMAKDATHMMATRRQDGQIGYFAATPEFLAEVLRTGERLN
jgi:hypothetical protein